MSLEAIPNHKYLTNWLTSTVYSNIGTRILPKMKSFSAEIFVLFFGMICIPRAESCEPTLCNIACNGLKPGMKGTCDGNNECDCSYSKDCSVLVASTCEVICGVLNLTGGYNENGHCICKAELEICELGDCKESCLKDIRARKRETDFGWVTTIWCMEYGSLKTCGCLCSLPWMKSRSDKPKLLVRRVSAPRNQLHKLKRLHTKQQASQFYSYRVNINV